jgi:hypothetical protein
VQVTGPGSVVAVGGDTILATRDNGRTWVRRASFTLPVPADGPPFQAELQCAEPVSAWVRFSGGGAAAGHSPYALSTTRDGGARWRGVPAEESTLGATLRLPPGPGSTPGPFSVIDPSSAFLLSPTPAAGAVGGVLVNGDQHPPKVSQIPGSVLLEPTSVGFASLTGGWAVEPAGDASVQGARAAGPPARPPGPPLGPGRSGHLHAAACSEQRDESTTNRMRAR